MTKYRICISLLSGLGFTSLVCLLLNIPVTNFFLLVLFIPGGIASRILPWSANWVSISILLGANVVIYSVPVFILILPRFTTIELETLQEDCASHGAPSGINVMPLPAFPL